MQRIQLFVVGISGKMGRAVCAAAAKNGFVVTGGLDAVKSDLAPTFARASEVNVPFDALIDFSRPNTLPEVCALARDRAAPCVLATTGYSAAQQEQIHALSRLVPVLQSANMSLGVAVLGELVRQAAALLPDFDLEIVERHHSAKADAPSGTARLLASEAAKARANALCVFGRKRTRQKNEIGIHAVRGGTVVGVHEVCFYGQNESLTLTHNAESREVFALGALAAARFVLSAPPALYGLQDIFIQRQQKIPPIQ